MLGEANCILSLGDLALRRSDNAAARSHWEEALALYARIPEAYSMGMTLRRLAGTEEAAARAVLVRRARELWLSIQRDDLVAQLDAEFGPQP